MTPTLWRPRYNEATGRTIDGSQTTTRHWTGGDGATIIVNTSSERFLDRSLQDPVGTKSRGPRATFTSLLMSDLSFGAADGEVPPAGPVWLRSGARHHFTGQTWKPAGPQTCSATKRYFEETWISSDVPLSDIATPEGYREVNAAWQLALLGVDLLAELAGPEAVVAYFVCAEVGHDMGTGIQ